ncbi:GPW/gp25 family protein [Pantoea allii]|uniref:GPW/gp25 family protein n=1 Tax=Pantoea allii TaxID=574096 RepID=UPI001F4E808A|nr:GPW/gp25 family protein [Pantoea allii]MCH9300370.1 GPW/gp25 family protein [Pantoea allii]
MYLGMNRDTGKALTDIDHIRQSVSDILLTPEGSRLARREYGSMLSALIDQPQNGVTRMQVMAATYTALSRWEPRIRLISVNFTTAYDGSMAVEISAQRADGSPLAMTIPTGVNRGSD